MFILRSVLFSSSIYVIYGCDLCYVDVIVVDEMYGPLCKVSGMSLGFMLSP